MKKRILLLTTGGTIASKKTDEGLAPGITGEELADWLPHLKNAYDHAVATEYNFLSYGDSMLIC